MEITPEIYYKKKEELKVEGKGAFEKSLAIFNDLISNNRRIHVLKIPEEYPSVLKQYLVENEKVVPFMKRSPDAIRHALDTLEDFISNIPIPFLPQLQEYTITHITVDDYIKDGIGYRFLTHRTVYTGMEVHDKLKEWFNNEVKGEASGPLEDVHPHIVKYFLEGKIDVKTIREMLYPYQEDGDWYQS